MIHPFIDKEYPKSTGRHEFGSEFVYKIIQEWKHLSHYDILRTFVSFTANSIWENILLIRNFTPQNWELIVSGGGVFHPVLMSDLEYYSSQKIKTSNDYGIDPEFKEGLLMSVLGAAKMMELPANMPTVTGANKRVSLGRIL
jgi:anhydro-N-acetylmuramic acid kinase